MSVLAIGALLLVAAVVFHFLGIFVKARAVMAFIGACIVTGGLFGQLLSRGVEIVNNLLGSVAARVFGIGLPGILVVVLGILFLHDLHPKKGAKPHTMYVGIALAACLVAGLSTITALNHIPSNVRTGVGTVTTIGG